MLTLKELKKIVKVADVEKRIPSVKSLKEHKVVVKEMINADTTISVYDHGYVLYTAGNQSTVFPLHSCDDYEYVSVTGDNKEFNKEFFDNENWYIRLLMEAEDRMAYSQSKISTNHGVFSNSDVTDDAEIMRGSSKDFVDDVIDREILNALIKELTERQKTVLNLVYFEEMRQQDVADYLGIKQQSVGVLVAGALKLVVYYRSKNAKKFRQGVEYGSARWGNRKDIEPFMDPVFENNVILTETERLTMNSRPKAPKYARNKNVIVIGGSGSGKTRFYVKPNLMQMTDHVSYVVTDPKGTIIVECGKMLVNGGYRIKVLNTINFKKSMHYNPFHYIRSEKDILKLVNTIIANTKGEGEKSTEDFWVSATRSQTVKSLRTSNGFPLSGELVV